MPATDPAPTGKASTAGAIYGPNLVFLGTLLGSLAGGGALMALNAWRLGRRRAATLLFAAGVGATAALMVLSSYVPEGSLAGSRLVGLLVALVGRQVAMLVQGRAYGEHLSEGGPRGRWWGALGVTLLVSVLVLLPLAVGVFVARFGLPALLG